uniref:Putative secreted protein n=1 Tax=Anopheles marajoara TaxID=58244 RepID=A0A2M4CFK1_9DIPT
MVRERACNRVTVAAVLICPCRATIRTSAPVRLHCHRSIGRRSVRCSWMCQSRTVTWSWWRSPMHAA